MKRWYQIQNLGSSVGEIRLRGIIGYSKEDQEGWFGKVEGEAGTVKEFEEELRELGDIAQLNVYISSEGGGVADGLAIYAILKRHNAKVVVHIDGYAFSIATVIAMAGDEIIMPANALMMIHNASCYAGGDYRDFERTSEALKVHNQAIRKAYAAKSGRSEQEFIALMDATTYMDGATAKSLGLVDVVTEDVAISNAVIHPRVRASADFAKIPAKFAAVFDIPRQPKPSAQPDPIMNKAILALAALAGIPTKENMTEDEIVAACQNHKPQAPKAELNLADEETKKLFNAAVAEGIQSALPEHLTKATAELEKKVADLSAIIRNGAAGSAGAGAPVHSPTAHAPEKTLTRSEFEALNHAERNDFIRKGGKITG